MNYKDIGLRIRFERKKLKISREKFAEIVDLSVNYLGQIERGEKKFSAETIVKISNSLHVSLDYLILGKVQSPSIRQKNELSDLLGRCSNKDLTIVIDVIKALVPHLNSSNINSCYKVQ